jgi:hypothetical protein
MKITEIFLCNNNNHNNKNLLNNITNKNNYDAIIDKYQQSHNDIIKKTYNITQYNQNEYIYEVHDTDITTPSKTNSNLNNSKIKMYTKIFSDKYAISHISDHNIYGSCIELSYNMNCCQIYYHEFKPIISDNFSIININRVEFIVDKIVIQFDTNTINSKDNKDSKNSNSKNSIGTYYSIKYMEI